MLNQHVLILNKNYEPFSVCTAKRAIVLVFLGKAEVVEHRPETVRSAFRSYPLPSIVRLMVYVRIPHKGIILSRKNIMKRDGHQCQYCGTMKGPLTVDHVLPKNRGGEDTWENLVCACLACNNRKGDKTAEQSRMRLLRSPKRPTHLHFIQNYVGGSDHRWRPYLFLE